MADLEDEPDDGLDDSGVYGAILDLRFGRLSQLESEWVGGPHAHDVDRAKATLAACRAALEHVAQALEAEANRSRPITASGTEVVQ